MTRPARIVDAHVHLWDPARTDWYPYLAGAMDIGMGDTSTMARSFDRETYGVEAAGWNVEKLVNVAAATGAKSVEETLAMEQRGEAEALIGDGDPKLAAFVPVLRKLIQDGFRPIVFCRFIQTAESLAAQADDTYTDILFLNAFLRWKMAQAEGHPTREKIAFGRLRHLRSLLQRRFSEVDEFDRHVETTRR